MYEHKKAKTKQNKTKAKQNKSNSSSECFALNLILTFVEKSIHK